MRVVLAGGSGFLGQVTAQRLTHDACDVVVLTRRPRSRTDGVREVPWDGRTVGPWAKELEGARAVVNFAGKNVNDRYTPAVKQQILHSRVDSTRALAAAIAACATPPQIWLQAASAAIYGDAGDRLLDEFTPPAPPPTDDPFSPNVCQAWELAVHAADTPQTRKIILRIGFVLHADHGALATLARLARCFVGGRAGAGTQYMSWLHHADFTQLVADIVAEPAAFSGTYLAVSPTPATNAHFMRELRRVLRRPWAPPAPAWLVRLGCFLMRTEPELALRSRRCYPRRLLDERGFRFRYPTLPEALAACYPRP